jgi:formylglycine-generating enzyme required for sulfatase activity
MRIFVSYARIDKPYCVQVVSRLDVHEIWYDQRLYAGQKWWIEIMRRLDWCQGFIYLMSPDSVASEYCQKELELALKLGKHIFPVLINAKTVLPPELADLQYIDLSSGPTVDNMVNLVNAIYLAEQTKHPQKHLSVEVISEEAKELPTPNDAGVISLAAHAMENGQFDKAVYLLQQAKEKGYKSQYINIDTMLAEAEAALARQAQLREVERDYRQISELVRLKRTHRLGCEAFLAFQKDFPNYDPDDLAEICAQSMQAQQSDRIAVPILRATRKPPLPSLEWCEIPSGLVKAEVSPNKTKRVRVDSFAMSKYPMTNAQYQTFIEAPDGYCDPVWWEFSPEARESRAKYPNPMPSSYAGPERPREMVNWYDAVAFCNWLSHRMQAKIILPHLLQRQRAVQGDDDRMFPWGDTFDTSYCNVKESDIKQTTFVARYANGGSPYGVYDLAGNVWEWCMDSRPDPKREDEPDAPELRVVHGGSFVSPASRAQARFYYALSPSTFYASIGFRVIQE